MTGQSVKKQSFRKYFRANWVFYAMSIPGLVYVIGYKILPLIGLQLAFKDFNMFLYQILMLWFGKLVVSFIFHILCLIILLSFYFRWIDI